MAHLIGHISGPATAVTMTHELQAKMELVSHECGFHVVTKAFHQFEPHGATGVLVLTESHFSAHTYPEDEMIYIDVFCCADTFDPHECSRVIERVFSSTSSNWYVIDRRP